jgi:hypothetical protein
MYMAFSITALSQRGSCRSDQCEIIVRVDSDSKVQADRGNNQSVVSSDQPTPSHTCQMPIYQHIGGPRSAPTSRKPSKCRASWHALSCFLSPVSQGQSASVDAGDPHLPRYARRLGISDSIVRALHCSCVTCWARFQPDERHASTISIWRRRFSRSSGLPALATLLAPQRLHVATGTPGILPKGVEGRI